ncbi:MAG TPA: type II secretion system protein GspG [Opitutaceae bacterium]|nr:type II secretion system protein GspG [Opitutaceae bacterium]
MLKTDGVALADSGMLRIRRTDVGPREHLSVAALVPMRSFQVRHFTFVNPRSGLTLIELIAVIAIIGVLAAITFGLASGVRERAAIGKARVEIAAIAQALEAYRVKYGDYPQTSDAATMLQCLIGKLGPTRVALTDKPLIEMGRFSTVNDSDPFTASTAMLMDPFGKPYNYAYKTSGSWKNPSFVLYSTGPDGAVEGALPADGFLTSAFETAFNAGSRTGNPDNIYHGRE